MFDPDCSNDEVRPQDIETEDLSFMLAKGSRVPQEIAYYFEIPEQGLLCAVIERAIRDALCTAKLFTDNYTVREARKWLLSEEHGPWSFNWCCEHLDAGNDFKQKVTATIQQRPEMKMFF